MVNKKVAVIGMWHLGLVYAASLAKKGQSVTGFDLNTKIIDSINEGNLPIFEPGLDENIKKYKKNLSFSSNPKDLKNKDYIFIAHDLEVDEHDVPHIETLKDIFDVVVKEASKNTTIVISSQVPVGTSRSLINLLIKAGNKSPKVIYFPENLRLGNAFEGFLNPDRIILGSDGEKPMEAFKKDFAFTCPIITMGLESAEMVKHALNSYLATCVSLSSELSDLSERTGANMIDVVKALKSDKRVSQFAPINPGLGFAGGTLGRDIQSLKIVGELHGYEPKLLDSVYAVNRQRIPRLVDRLQKVLGSLKGKKVAILGLTYKPNTNTLRRSMSLELADALKQKGSVVSAYDPVIKGSVPEYSYLEIKASTKEAFEGSDAVILMTDWAEFLTIDIKKLSKTMNTKVFFDTKNIFDASKFKKTDVGYYGMGI